MKGALSTIMIDLQVKKKNKEKMPLSTQIYIEWINVEAKWLEVLSFKEKVTKGRSFWAIAMLSESNKRCRTNQGHVQWHDH